MSDLQSFQSKVYLTILIHHILEFSYKHQDGDGTVCLIYNHFKLSRVLPQDSSKQPCDTELELIMGRGVS